jgi:hypothetical protein
MGNNTLRNRIRDTAWMVGTIMVLYGAMAFSLVMGIYQKIFKHCKNG